MKGKKRGDGCAGCVDLFQTLDEVNLEKPD